MKYYILYNPLAGHGKTQKKLDGLKSVLDGECVECNVTEITDYPGLISSLQPDDKLVLSGGDGTLNNFINSVDTDNIINEILYYPSGSGNDFLHDVRPDYDGKPFVINQYLKNLPTVTVKGRTYRFINGIGYGIDGWCCEIGDQLKAKGKAVNYTNIAIKGLVYAYTPRNAKVTVDGKEYSFKKVWIAPTMNGRFYGGGMMSAPEQDRLNPDGTLSVMLFYGKGRLKTLMAFPSIFKGEHVKKTKMVAIHTGKEITVTFDKPAPVQIDGETILGVTSYTAKAASKVAATV